MKRPSKISDQVKEVVKDGVPERPKYTGNTDIMISTGSTLLDLAISGGRTRTGGIPGGILVEIFGPSSAGKTVLLSEIAGDIQRKGGSTMFYDPEARLNKEFTKIFGFDLSLSDYETPDTVTDVFNNIEKWEPKTPDAINGIFTDSLAALSTNLEMGNDDGDKMGMRRAKEFSTGCRKIARFLTQKNLLMVCSNQVRINIDAGPYGQKYTTPGGESIGFFASLRLRAHSPEKIKIKKKIKGKEIISTKGVTTMFEVYKSSIWKPFRTASVSILFDYGIDDIRQNLIYIKQFSPKTVYTVNDDELSKSLEESILIIENEGREAELKEQVIEVWNNVETEFETQRKKKIR